MISVHSKTEIPVFSSNSNKPVRLEVNANILGKLMAEGYIHAADFRCLDYDSKQCVHKLCLNHCANCLLK
jgi:hypothetical protein